MTVFHIFLSLNLGLTEDESYYWVWSRRLEISYYDHPPMIAYMIRLFTSIFGNNLIATRLPAVLSITITSIYIYKIINYLYQDKNKAFLGVALFNIIPVYAVLSFMPLPDLPLILFYTISLYYFIRVIYEKKPQLWYIIGITIGLGLLSKYNMFLVYPGIFFFLIYHKNERFWFKKKELYISFFLSLLFLLPVVVWNIQHNWASFAFHLYGRHQRGGGPSIKPHLFLAFMLAQFIIFSPVLFTRLFKVIPANLNKKDVKLLFFYGAPVFFIFMLASFFTKSQIHWTATAYIPFLIILVRYTNWNKFWRYIGIGAAILLTLFLYTQSFYPVVKINPPEADVTTDMHGWDKVGREVDKLYNNVIKNENNNNWFIFSNIYQITSQLTFYLPEQPYVYCLNNNLDQFDFWQDISELEGKNGIFVTQGFYKVNPDKIYNFERVELAKEIDIIRAGKGYRTFYVYKCYNFMGVKK